jgi:hypothetical protein
MPTRLALNIANATAIDRFNVSIRRPPRRRGDADLTNLRRQAVESRSKATIGNSEISAMILSTALLAASGLLRPMTDRGIGKVAP